MVLVPLAERSAVNFVHLRRVISSSFATSQGSMGSLICQRSNLFYLFPFLFRLGPKISRRDLLLVEECCNTSDSMRQVSFSYSSSLPCHLLACCILACHHVHFILHTCSSHASEHFPRCPFCIPTLPHAPAHPSCIFS